MKNIKKGLWASVLLLLSVSCQESMYYGEDSSATSSESRKPVFFSGNVLTRMANNAWEEGDEIGVYMLNAGETLSDESVLSDSSNRRYAFTTSLNGFAPRTKNDTLFYPQTGEVDFVAYYPYKPVEGYAVAVDVSSQTRPAAIDFLHSNNLKNITKGDEVLTLKFRHELSKIVFSLSAGEGFAQDDLAGIKLTVEDVMAEGSFNLATGTLTNDESSVRNIAAEVNEAGTQAEAIMLPQSCNKKRVKVTMGSMRSFTFEIVSTEAWLAAHKYTYNIVLNKDDYSVPGLQSSVEDWIDEGPSGLNQSGSSDVDTSVWDGASIDTDWYSAAATSFEIATAEELAGLSELVKEGTTFKGKTVRLSADIDLDGHDWTPIGQTQELAFRGLFDGGNHTISGLSPKLADGCKAAGLFGDNSGTIQNVIVNGKIVYETSAGICSVSSIVGINRGTVKGCRNYASVSGTLLQTPDAKSILYLGGIMGANFGTVSDCRNEGSVTGDNQNSAIPCKTYVGGVTGITASEISASENGQDVSCKGDSVYVGGIVGAVSYSGSLYGKVSSCRNYGAVKAETGSRVLNAGGIAGYVATLNNEVTGSHNYAEVKATISNAEAYAKAGGVVGENESGTLRSNTNSGFVTASNTGNSAYSAAGGIVGNNTKGGEVHACTNKASALVQAHLVGGIAGVNNRIAGSEAYVYDCCTNGGTPSKWIGNAVGNSSKSGVTTTSHSDE